MWERLLAVLIDDPDYEWLIIDTSHCKVHPHAAGAAGGNQAMGRTKGGSTRSCIWPWMRMVCRSRAIGQKLLSGFLSYCIEKCLIVPVWLIADRGYDSNAVINQAQQQGMRVVISPRKNRKVQRPYDKDLYKIHVKRWRSIATRYAKNTASFLAAVHIRCIAIWLNATS